MATAVDAFSNATLEHYGVESLQDLIKIAPSVQVVSAGATLQRVVIRGISSSVGRTAGLYLDEAPLVGGYAATVASDGSPGLRMHDIDHVEVLKGPQGTLFGAGSMSGTLRMITAKPKLDDFEASVEGRGAAVSGGNALWDGNAMVNVPIVQDKLGIRIVGWGESGGGYIDQTIFGQTTTYKNANDISLKGVRAEVLFTPTERLKLFGSYSYQNTRVAGAEAWTLYLGPMTGGGGQTGPYPANTNHSPLQEPENTRYELFTGTAEYDLGFGSIVLTGTHADSHLWQPLDTSPTLCSFGICSGSSQFPAAWASDEPFSDTTAELRFSSQFSGPLQLVAGGYYERDKADFNAAVITPDALTGKLPCDTYVACGAAGLLTPHGVVFYSTSTYQTTPQYAAYAQADYKVVENVTLTAGVRKFWADQNQEWWGNQDIGDSFGGKVTTPHRTATGKISQSKTTYNFAALWTPTPDISVYARAASGFRLGGINQSAQIANNAGAHVPAGYDSDSLWEYEAGGEILPARPPPLHRPVRLPHRLVEPAVERHGQRLPLSAQRRQDAQLRP